MGIDSQRASRTRGETGVCECVGERGFGGEWRERGGGGEGAGGTVREEGSAVGVGVFREG